MTNPIQVTIFSGTHHVFVRAMSDILVFKEAGGLIAPDKSYTPDCDLCNKKTERCQFYSVSYSTHGNVDEYDNAAEATPLGYICASHLEEEGFGSIVANFVSKRLADISTDILRLPHESLTITRREF